MSKIFKLSDFEKKYKFCSWSNCYKASKYEVKSKHEKYLYAKNLIGCLTREIAYCGEHINIVIDIMSELVDYYPITQEELISDYKYGILKEKRKSYELKIKYSMQKI